MSQRRLPSECILNIIRLLSDEYDTDTMASLLCVNKSICAATLPFLYQDCFNDSMHKNRPHSNKDPKITTAQMMRTLLRQVRPQSRIPDILKATYLSQDDQSNLESTAVSPQPAPVFKYRQFIRHIKVYYVHQYCMFEPVHTNSPLMDYAATNQLYERFVDEGYITSNVPDVYRNNALAMVLEMVFFQQLTWTLCQDFPESIESLKIPLHDIQRYIDHVHRFTSLSDVRFSVQGVGLYRRFMPVDIQGPNLIQPEERVRYLEGMMEFVRRHTSIHKNVLQKVELPHLSDRDGTGQRLHFAIQSLLPPFQISRSIDTDWIGLLARHTDANLGYLESLTLNHNFRYQQVEEISKVLASHPPLLPRCRALKHLIAETLGPDMFEWAVMEKKKKDAQHQQESTVGGYSSSWQHSHYNNGLVPLQSIKITNQKASPLVQELNDIAFAFSDSLEELCVDDGRWGFKEFVEDTNASRTVFYGQGWHLPHLRCLFSDVFDLRLHFDMDALQRCRALESLTLRDAVVNYRHRDIRSWSVVHLLHLKRLDLKGSPALHFNMESLHHSPCLEELTLKMDTAFRGTFWCFLIPYPEELECEDSDTEAVDGHESSGIPGSNQGHQSIGRRPRYTWDWHLPKLYKLELAAVFAFMFDFQWLQYLPNLRSLRLSTISWANKLHERHITLKDLSKREQQQPLDEYGPREILSDRYIGLPKLESIELDGSWIFEENVLEVLCMRVAPNLHCINFGSDCTGFTLEECITLSRKMPHLKKILLILPWTHDEIRQLGLIPGKDLQDEQRNKKCVEYSLDRNIFYDAQGL
ncbi:MAG: hypothetical protein J3Q66DRAFT_398585 [Benniella sp.]|nr:MAG: hypothetical protein J3Q66DRAFT_398585 [Benniella sp.]